MANLNVTECVCTSNRIPVFWPPLLSGCVAEAPKKKIKNASFSVQVMCFIVTVLIISPSQLCRPHKNELAGCVWTTGVKCDCFNSACFMLNVIARSFTQVDDVCCVAVARLFTQKL